MEFKNLEVSDTAAIMGLRNFIEEKHGQIDVLINNAGMYFYPTTDNTEHFVQVQRTLDINYWGMKNVISSFLSLMSDQSRIVNMSSYHGHLSRIPGRSIQMQLGRQKTTNFCLPLKFNQTILHRGFIANREASGRLNDGISETFYRVQLRL